MAAPTLTDGRITAALRGVLFGACVATAGRGLLAEGAVAFTDGTPYRALLLAPLGAAVSAVIVHRAAKTEIDVHDRHVDVVSAIGLIGVATLLSTLFSQRLGAISSAVRIDLLAVPVWTAAFSMVLFGTRPTWRHRRSLAVLALAWPLPYNVLANHEPRALFGAHVAGTIVVGTVLAASRLSGRRFLLILAFGLVTVVVAGEIVEANGLEALAWTVPVVTGALTLAAVAVERWMSEDDGDAAPAPAPATGPGRPVVESVRRVALPVLAVAALLGVAQVRPVEGRTLVGAAELAIPADDAELCSPPPGWLLHEVDQVGAVDRSVGRVPTRRCLFARIGGAIPGEPGWMIMDVTAPTSVQELGSFPFSTAYRTPGSESPVQARVGLPGGGQGWLLTYSSTALPLTTVVLTVDVIDPDRAGTARRVTFAATDDPRHTAPFPEPKPQILRAVLDRVGNTIRISPKAARAVTPVPKNAPLVEQAAGSILDGWVVR